MGSSSSTRISLLGCSEHHFEASHSFPELPEASRAFQSSPLLSRVTQSSPELPEASRSFPKLPRASQSFAELPKASQSSWLPQLISLINGASRGGYPIPDRKWSKVDVFIHRIVIETASLIYPTNYDYMGPQIPTTWDWPNQSPHT